MQIKEPKIDFFIVGWPKTGSTSLHYYLSQHPEISMSSKKESYYFAKDIIADADTIGSGQFYNYRTSEEYAAIFEETATNKKQGESSVFYIISEVALSEIIKNNPGAKIIVLLRNPAELASSWYHHLKQHSREDTLSITESFNLQADRKKGHKLPINTHTPIHLQYDEILNFPKHLKKAKSLFAERNIHVIVYDDLKNEQEHTVEECFKFLGVETTFKPDFSKRNVSRKVKNSRMKKIIDSNKRGVVYILRKLGLLSEGSFLHKIYTKTFTQGEKRDDTVANEYDLLQDRYKNVVFETEKLVQKNLMTRWNY